MKCQSLYPPPPLSFPTPGKTVPHHPPEDCSTAVHAHCGAQKLRQKRDNTA